MSSVLYENSDFTRNRRVSSEGRIHVLVRYRLSYGSPCNYVLILSISQGLRMTLHQQLTSNDKSDGRRIGQGHYS